MKSLPCFDLSILPPHWDGRLVCSLVNETVCFTEPRKMAIHD